MVIIDPILEHMRADKEQATREAYAPLRALIAQRGVALLQVAHTNKRSAQNLGSVGDKVGGVKALVSLPLFIIPFTLPMMGFHGGYGEAEQLGKRVTHSMDFRIEEVDGQPHVAWTGAGSAAASDGLTIQGEKTRGGCADDLKTLLTRDWQESAGLKGKLLSIGYGLATVSRAAAQLVLTGELEQDRRGRLTFWRIMPLGHHETEEAKACVSAKDVGCGEIVL